MENNKFLSFEGVIGRRGFIVNFLLITVIICVASIFLNILLFTVNFPLFNPKLDIILNMVAIFLLYPSLERRIKDIFGKDERDLNLYLLMFMTIIGLCIPLINLCILIALMVAEGKITGEMPKDKIIKFNWGAFLGTWIWGLFNKSYKTLWMIPLIITPAAIPFALICGLKGNEWAYKNKQIENIDKFHESQKLQAVIWTILYPVLYIIITIAIAMGTVSFVKHVEKQHPGLVKIKVEKAFKGFIKTVNVNLYTNYEKTDNGYKFYVEPKNWINLSKKNKTSSYVLALYNVMFDEGIGFDAKTSLNSIINTTKIYSSFNNELLCETIIPESETVTISNMPEAIQKYITINNNPSTP